MFNWKKPTTAMSAPPYGLYAPTDGDGEMWTRIGDAWPLESGDGYLLGLALMPLNGRFIMRRIHDA